MKQATTSPTVTANIDRAHVAERIGSHDGAALYYDAAIGELSTQRTAPEAETLLWQVVGERAMSSARRPDNPANPELNEQRLVNACGDLTVARNGLTQVIQQAMAGRGTSQKYAVYHEASAQRAEIDRQWVRLNLALVIQRDPTRGKEGHLLLSRKAREELARTLQHANLDALQGNNAEILANVIADGRLLEKLLGTLAAGRGAAFWRGVWDRRAVRWARRHDARHAPDMRRILQSSKTETSSYPAAVRAIFAELGVRSPLDTPVPLPARS